MHSPELTVIVPCYNVAEFVSACLRSIFNQPQADKLKILVVDDGSVDNTSEVILAEIAARPHVNCELITQTNQGASCARNAALRLVRTSYVTFLDGDDFWAANHLEVVMPLIDQGRADIIAFNASIVDMGGRRLGCLQSHTRFTSEARFSCSELIADAASVAEWHPTTRIFKTRLLDGICFPPGRYYEDAAVLPSLYEKASHIETLRDELYVYRHRPGAITSSITDKHIDDLLLNAREATERITEGSSYWKTVRRKMILQIAREIGRAPRALRRSMFSRAWPDVRAHSDLNFRLNWILRMLDVCLRSEAKSLLGLNARLFGSHVHPRPNVGPKGEDLHSLVLTVIVPCYNVAEFVPACLRSIFNQPQADKLKILVIDDGSMDNTSQVVLAEIAAHQEMSCELITQTNQGLSGARNTGLRLARTPYVTFVDGDDFWAANHLELVMPLVCEGRADIIAFNASVVDMGGRRLDSLRVHTRFTSEARFSCSELASDAATVGEWQAWARIYKTRLLGGISFPPGRYYEDAAFVPSLYAKASHIETFKEELYAYRRRPGSITSWVTDKHIDDLLLNAREATARITEGSSYWMAVRRKIILRIASEIGRAPRALRRSMFSRAWPDVQAHSDLIFRLNWILRMLDVCLRSEAKSLLGLNGRLPGSHVYPPASSPLK